MSSLIASLLGSLGLGPEFAPLVMTSLIAVASLFLLLTLGSFRGSGKKKTKSTVNEKGEQKKNDYENCRQYSRAEVSKHNTRDDVWIIVQHQASRTRLMRTIDTSESSRCARKPLMRLAYPRRQLGSWPISWTPRALPWDLPRPGRQWITDICGIFFWKNRRPSSGGSTTSHRTSRSIRGATRSSRTQVSEITRSTAILPLPKTPELRCREGQHHGLPRGPASPARL